MSETLSETARTHLQWAMADGIGPIVFGRLLMHFGDAEKALGVSAAQLQDVKGIGRDTAEKVARSRDAAAVEAEIAIAAEHGVRIICREDPEFPKGLLQIPDTPIVLYAKGELRETDAVSIAIVGTRKCTIYGSEQARRFAELLAGVGFTVVSGLARGIDAFAHHGAVDADGRSIAVLGNGLCEVYPAENRALAEKLLENGVLLSELPMRTAVRRENFEPRNRIIAGLTLGTLVVEAPDRSGAKITARFANEYNREVFAVPGRVQDPTAFGTNALIRDGAAKLVTCLEDVLEELGEVGLTMMRTGESPDAAGEQDSTGQGGPSEPMSSRSTPRLNAPESKVFELIPFDPILQDAVISASSLPPGEVLAAFTSLELKGLIKRLPGQLITRHGRA